MLGVCNLTDSEETEDKRDLEDYKLGFRIEQLSSQVSKLEEQVDQLQHEIDNLSEKHAKDISRVQDDIKDVQDYLIGEVNKLAQSEQEYRDALNSQLKQAIGLVFSFIITKLLNSVF